MEVEGAGGAETIWGKKKHEDVPEKDADLDEDKSKETEQEVKGEGESSKSRSFRGKMRGLSPHHLPLKDRMRDKNNFLYRLALTGSTSRGDHSIVKLNIMHVRPKQIYFW